MFVNSNYQAKLSPTMTENWLVQIFKNNNSSIATTDTPDLKFSFSETTYNSLQYYPAILNKPSISYSLDLKGFTTKTGNVTLNLANIDLDGTTLLGLLGNEYINGHVNILSQIDNDNTANNALQLFSGKISSFGYRGNMIVMDVISYRPFQNVSLPVNRTTSSNEQYDNKYIPMIYGEYQPTTGTLFAGEVFACPFLKNDGANFLYIVPEGVAVNTNKLEYYDKSLKRFATLTDTNTSIVEIDGADTLSVPRTMKRVFDLSPDDITDFTALASETITSGSLSNANDGTTSTSFTVTDGGGFQEQSGGFKIKLKLPQVTGKVTALKITIDGDITQTISTTGTTSQDGTRIIIQDAISGATADAFVLGGVSSYNQDSTIDLTATCTDVGITTLITEGTSATLPSEVWLHFDLNADYDNQSRYESYTITIEEISFEVTVENDLDNEPVASTSFNAGVSEVYLGRDVTTPTFYEHSTASEINELNNPVAIHRQLLYEALALDYLTTDTKVEDSGFKSVAELRDSLETSPTKHWETRVQINKREMLESVLQKLQYEGCFFFEFSPQAQQTTTISGVAPLRYFTIEDSVTAAADLSQNDISDYELGITPAQDLETSLLVSYKPHPAENQYLKKYLYPSTSDFATSKHNTFFGDREVQKQEINLDYVYASVDEITGSRNSSWINFRESLFGDYKTIVNATLVNPEKYGMLQVGDFIDFGEITFSELGSPFDSISDTFDSYVAMPTRLFSAAWSGKKFIITNLKRSIGKITIQTQEV